MFTGAMAAGLGAGALALVLTLRPDLANLRPEIAAIDRTDAAPADAARDWPALFGTVPAADPADTPPPDTTTDYRLKGLVTAEAGGWAIIADAEADIFVEPGSVLPDTAVVTAITRDGVEIERGGKRLMIRFDETASAAAATALSEAPPAPRLATARLSLKQLREDGFRRTLGLAGGTQIVDRGNGVMAQEIVWVRNGRFYDRIGLRQGDILLTLNGIPAGDIEALIAATPELLRQRRFEVEILRAGARMTLEVIVDEDV